jgi:aspartate--ammonia ligase
LSFLQSAVKNIYSALR